MRSKLLTLAVVVLLVGGGVFAVVRGGSDPSDDQRSRQTPPPQAEPEAPAFVLAASSNLYVVDVASRSVKRITRYDDEETASDPSWSAAGIVFNKIAARGMRPTLAFVKPDGSRGRRPPRSIRDLIQPAWAPDGRRIAAVALGLGIRVADARSGSVRQLTPNSPGSGAPAWSPDGETIVFQGPGTGTQKLELYEVKTSTGAQRRLTRDQLQQSDPSWSPDGSRLVFAEQKATGNWVLTSMRPDGSDRKELTEESYSSQEPSWCPAGGKIAFAFQQGGRGSIAVVDAKGGRPAGITPRRLVAVSQPACSPDGKRIAFVGRLGKRPPPSAAPGGPVIPGG